MKQSGGFIDRSSISSNPSHGNVEKRSSKSKLDAKSIINRYIMLHKSSSRTYNNLKRMPYSCDRSIWQPFFQESFTYFNQLWRYQQDHRRVLEQGCNLNRIEIGEIARKIGELYLQYYLRTSDTRYLQLSYKFYEAIRSRKYFQRVRKREDFVSLLKAQAKFILVCILQNKRLLVLRLLNEFKQMIRICGRRDQKAFERTFLEMTHFLRADMTVTVGNNPNQISYRDQTPPATEEGWARDLENTRSFTEASVRGPIDSVLRMDDSPTSASPISPSSLNAEKPMSFGFMTPTETGRQQIPFFVIEEFERKRQESMMKMKIRKKKKKKKRKKKLELSTIRKVKEMRKDVEEILRSSPNNNTSEVNSSEEKQVESTEESSGLEEEKNETSSSTPSSSSQQQQKRSTGPPNIVPLRLGRALILSSPQRSLPLNFVSLTLNMYRILQSLEREPILTVTDFDKNTALHGEAVLEDMRTKNCDKSYLSRTSFGRVMKHLSSFYVSPRTVPMTSSSSSSSSKKQRRRRNGSHHHQSRKSSFSSLKRENNKILLLYIDLNCIRIKSSTSGQEDDNNNNSKNENEEEEEEEEEESCFILDDNNFRISPKIFPKKRDKNNKTNGIFHRFERSIINDDDNNNNDDDDEIELESRLNSNYILRMFDLLPFTRRPMMMIIDTNQEFEFDFHEKLRYFGGGFFHDDDRVSHFLCLYYKDMMIPPCGYNNTNVENRSRRRDSNAIILGMDDLFAGGKIFTYFLTSPIIAFLNLLEIREITNEMYQIMIEVMNESFEKTKKTIIEFNNKNTQQQQQEKKEKEKEQKQQQKNINLFMFDTFTSQYVLRFVFVANVFLYFKRMDEYRSLGSFPKLPEFLFDQQQQQQQTNINNNNNNKTTEEEEEEENEMLSLIKELERIVNQKN